MEGRNSVSRPAASGFIITALATSACPAFSESPTSPIIGVDPPSLDFGSVTVGWDNYLTAQLYNANTNPTSILRITQISISGAGFNLFSGPPLPVNIPGGAGTVPLSLRFTPTREGSAAGTFTIAASNAQGVTRPLLGSGTTALPGDLPCAQTAFVIASNKELVHLTGPDSLHYHQGEQVIIAYLNGMLTLNGRPLQQPVPEGLHPYELLHRLYGDVPFVQQRVATNPLPDSTVRWNQAYQAWVQARTQLTASARRAFDDARQAGLSLDDAVARAAAILRGNQQLVASVTTPEQRFPEVPAPYRNLIVHWRGTFKETYEFPAPPRPRALQPGDTMDPEAACALIRTLQGILEETNGIPGRIELNNGNINILGEESTVRRHAEGR